MSSPHSGSRRARSVLVAGLVVATGWSAAITQAPVAASTAATVLPLARAGGDVLLRLDDSPAVRQATKVVYSGALAAGAAKAVPVAGHAGVPATGAGSVILSVLTSGAGGPGSLRVAPTGDAADRMAPMTFTGTSQDTRELIVKVGRGGSIDLRPTRTVNARVSVLGWFPEGDSLIPMTPVMAFGSRTAARTVGASRTLRLPGVPAGLAGAAVVTATTSGSSRAGVLSLAPGGTMRATSVQFPARALRAQQLVVPVSRAGTIAVSASNATGLRLEVTGWMPLGSRAASSSGAPVGSDVVSPTHPLTLTLAGERGVPAAGAGAVAVTLTTTNARRPGRLTVIRSATYTQDVAFPRGTASQTISTPLNARGKVTIRSTYPVTLTVAVSSYQRAGNRHFNRLLVPAATTLYGPGDITGAVPTVRDGKDTYSVLLSPSADRIGVGEYAAIGATASNPSGLIGKVAAASDEAGGQRVELTLAPLADAFKAMDVTYTGAGTAVLRRTVAGQRVYARVPFQTPSVNVLGLDCGLGMLSASLNLEIGAHFDDMALQFGFTKTYFNMKASVSAEVTASVKGGLRVDCSKDSPALVGWSVPTAIGPIALTARSTFKLSGSVDAFELTAKGGLDLTIAARYQDGRWSSSGSDFGWHPDKPVVKGVEDPGSEISVAWGPKLQGMIWGRVGVGIFAGPQATIKTQLKDGNHLCTVDIGATAKLSLDADFVVAQASVDFASVASVGTNFDLGICGVIAYPKVGNTSLDNGLTGVGYYLRLNPVDGQGPFTWSATGLPAGLSVQNGAIAGTPTEVGTAHPAITVTDVFGRSGSKTMALTVAQPTSETQSLLGHIARLSSGESWYVDKRGSRHAIADGGTYQCLQAQGVPVSDTTSAAVAPLQVIEPAQCVTAKVGDVVRTKDGDSYLINADWSRSWIVDGRTYECLTLNGNPAYGTNVPRYWLMDLAQGADESWNCVDPVGSRGHLVRASDGTSWYVDLRGGRHWVPDGGTFDCLSQQGKTPMPNKIPAWAVPSLGKEGEAAACVRAAPGDIIRNDSGDADLIRADWTRGWIPDGGSYECLLVNGHKLVDHVPRYYIDDLTQGPDAKTSCYDANLVKGKVVRGSDGKSWYVDKRGGKHWIPDGGTFDCIAAQTGGAWSQVVPAAWLTQPKYEDAKCIKANPGNIIRTPDGDAYVVAADWTRGWIPDGGSFRCLQANGHATIDGVPRYYIDDLTAGANVTMSCYDSNAVKGKVVRSDANGTSWYVDKRGGKHWIPDGGTFDCIAAQTGGAYQYTVPAEWLTQTRYEDAKCVRAAPGNLIRNANGDAYLLNADWTRGWIPTATAYQCWMAEGRTLVDNVPRYYIDDLTQAGNATYPGTNCMVRRGSDGAVYFVNNEGKREWVPDGPTYNCETGRGIHVLGPSDAFINAIPEVGWHYCLNKSQLLNSILTHTDGDSHMIYGDGTRHWIPDEFTYNCRRNQGYGAQTTRWREYITAFPEGAWDNCFDVNTFKNKFVKDDADGTVWFIDEAGVKHWVPSETYNCMVGRFGQPRVTKRQNYIDAMASGDWAVCGDTLRPNQNMDRGQWLSSGNGYTLRMQYDGNLVMYTGSGGVVWASGTGSNARKVRFDGNGALSIQDGSGNWIKHICNSWGSNANRFVVQGDSNLVLYRDNTPLWSRSTALCAN